MGLAKRLGLKAGEDILDRGGKLLESWEDRNQRLIFEKSHRFKVGEKVVISTLPDVSFRVYQSLLGTVIRTVTSRDTGACIRVEFGGVGLNFWNPEQELVHATELAKLLYR